MGAYGTILGVWAHPDDETYLSAGVMAQAVHEGDRVVCVTATRGEEGSWDEERWPPAEMGKVREAELLECLAILGVREHHWLDVVDGTCERLTLEQGVALVQPLLAEVQPDLVLTFGPEGMTDHADHKAVNSWTGEAFRREAKPGSRLLYATYTKEWADEFVPIMNRFNVFAEGTPPVTPRDELEIGFELPPDLLELKIRGIEAHVSQIEGMLKAFGEDFFRRAMAAEYFRLGDSA